MKGLQIKFVGCDVEECPTPDRIQAIVQVCVCPITQSINYHAFMIR